MQKKSYDHFMKQARLASVIGIPADEKQELMDCVISMATSEYWTATGIHFTDWIEINALLVKAKKPGFIWKIYDFFRTIKCNAYVRKCAKQGF